MSPGSSIPPIGAHYFSEAEQTYTKKLLDAAEHSEGMEISDYTRKVIRNMQAGMNKAEAHKDAMNGAGLMKSLLRPTINSSEK